MVIVNIAILGSLFVDLTGEKQTKTKNLSFENENLLAQRHEGTQGRPIKLLWSMIFV